MPLFPPLFPPPPFFLSFPPLPDPYLAEINSIEINEKKKKIQSKTEGPPNCAFLKRRDTTKGGEEGWGGEGGGANCAGETGKGTGGDAKSE